MSRPLSPIERMIDVACGHSSAERPVVRRDMTLRCPSCHRQMLVRRHETDPANAAVIEYPCDKCDAAGNKAECSYFDASGRQISIAGEPL